MMYRHS